MAKPHKLIHCVLHKIMRNFPSLFLCCFQLSYCVEAQKHISHIRNIAGNRVRKQKNKFQKSSSEIIKEKENYSIHSSAEASYTSFFSSFCAAGSTL